MFQRLLFHGLSCLILTAALSGEYGSLVKATEVSGSKSHRTYTQAAGLQNLCFSQNAVLLHLNNKVILTRTDLLGSRWPIAIPNSSLGQMML